MRFVVEIMVEAMQHSMKAVVKCVCSDRILTCRIKSIRSPAKVGLVVTDLITSPVVSWEGWETPPSTEAQLSFFAQPPAW